MTPRVPLRVRRARLALVLAVRANGIPLEATDQLFKAPSIWVLVLTCQSRDELQSFLDEFMAWNAARAARAAQSAARRPYPVADPPPAALHALDMLKSRPWAQGE